MNKILLSFLFFFAAILNAYSQFMPFKHLGPEDGLEGSQINGICKDSRGFMWFANNSGLTRFDGVSMRHYHANFFVSSSLPDSYVQSVQEDAQGLLWICANGNYVVMDPRTEIFDRSISQRLAVIESNLEPSLIYVDRNHNLWVYLKNQMLYYYKINQQLVYKFPQGGDNPILPEGEITGFASTAHGVVAVYSNGLVTAIDGEHQNVMWNNNVLVKNQIPEDRFNVFVDKSQNIWVYGLYTTYVYNSEKHIWHRSLDEACSDLLGEVNVSESLATGIAEDSKGRVWVATDRSGLLMFNFESKNVLQQKYNPSDGRSLNTKFLHSLYVDDMDVVWVGSQRHGVSYWAPSLYMFQVDPIADVNSMAQDAEGNLWLATRDKGLVRRSSDGIETVTYNRSNGLCDNLFSRVAVSRDGSLWVGSSRFGLSRMKGNNVTNYMAQKGKDDGLLDNCIQDLSADSYGNIWIATRQKGLQCLNPTTGLFSNFNVGNGKLPSNDVSCIDARQNKIVVGTSNGISIINISNNDIRFYVGNSTGTQHFTNNSVSQVLCDSRGLIWVGTRDGLNVLDLSRDELTIFTTSDGGIPSNVICGLAEDASHDVWVTTNRGVCRISLQKNPISPGKYQYALSNYDVIDGLQGMEFNPGAILATKTNLYMGGQGGINWVSAYTSRKVNHQVKIILSHLTIDGRLVTPDTKFNGRYVLSQILDNTDRVHINRDEHTVAFTVSLSDYGHAEHPRFTYMVEGLNDDNWCPVESDGHTIKLVGLSSGTHKVHIRGSLDGGNTVAEERVIEFVMQGAWWMSWWTLLAVLALIGLVVGLYFYFIPSLLTFFRRRKREIVQYKNERERLSALASDIRQDVVGMIPELGLLQMEAASGRDKERLMAMQHAARQMLTKLNTLRDSQNLVLHDAGLDNEIIFDDSKQSQESAKDSEEILFSDEGVVQGNVMITDDGEIQELATLKYMIFLVDKDPDMLEFMADCLKNTYQIRTFTGSDAVWEAILESKPDLVIAHQTLDQLSGSDLCHKIKNERAFERLPFVLVTDSVITTNDFVRNKITLLADDYLAQPMNLKSSTVRINRLLGVGLNEADEKLSDDTTRGADAMLLASKLTLRQTVTDYVLQNISRKDLSLEELSRVLGINRVLLFRKVENVTGRAPADFIRAVRLQEAAQLMSNGILSPTEVADELGFASPQSFSYYFQLEFGMLPTEYMEQMAGLSTNSTLR